MIADAAKCIAVHPFIFPLLCPSQSMSFLFLRFGSNQPIKMWETCCIPTPLNQELYNIQFFGLIMSTL